MPSADRVHGLRPPVLRSLTRNPQGLGLGSLMSTEAAAAVCPCTPAGGGPSLEEGVLRVP